jgi:TfoX/Sxy family transcriptional regulator of competence genes
MAFNEKLAERIREALVDVPKTIEKNMFGGVCFMVNNKMCVGVVNDEMMCRIHPAIQEEVLELVGCRMMDFTGKPMEGYVYVSEEGLKSKKKTLCFGLHFASTLTKRRKRQRKKLKRRVSLPFTALRYSLDIEKLCQKKY